MYPIVKKRVLNEEVSLMEVRAPLAARRARPGRRSAPAPAATS